MTNFRTVTCITPTTFSLSNSLLSRPKVELILYLPELPLSPPQRMPNQAIALAYSPDVRSKLAELG